MTHRSLLRLALLLALMLVLTACGGRAPQGVSGHSKADNAVRAAYSQMGNHYVMGGASPRQGFDCSGLVYWAYRSNGVAVPRLTRDQARAGKGVSRGNAKPGDIVVFRIGKNGRTLHTGLYAGGNSFIHSPRRGKSVRMDTLSQPYWNNRLVAVRRVAM